MNLWNNWTALWILSYKFCTFAHFLQLIFFVRFLSRAHQYKKESFKFLIWRQFVRFAFNFVAGLVMPQNGDHWIQWISFGSAYCCYCTSAIARMNLCVCISIFIEAVCKMLAFRTSDESCGDDNDVVHTIHDL